MEASNEKMSEYMVSEMRIHLVPLTTGFHEYIYIASQSIKLKGKGKVVPVPN
jgi:hypothetical protein